MSYLYTMLNADANEVSTRFEHVRSELASENEETRPDVVSSSLDVSTSNVLEDEVTEGDIQFLHNLDVVGVERMMKMKLPYGYSMQALDPKLVAGGIVALLGLVGLGFLAKRMEWFKSDSDKNSDAGSKGSDSIDKADKSASSMDSGNYSSVTTVLGEVQKLLNQKRTIAADSIIKEKALKPDVILSVLSSIDNDLQVVTKMLHTLSPLIGGLKGYAADFAAGVSTDIIENMNSQASNLKSAINDAIDDLKLGNLDDINAAMKTLTSGGDYDIGTEVKPDAKLDYYKDIRSKLISNKEKLTNLIQDNKLIILESTQVGEIKTQLPKLDDAIKSVNSVTSNASKKLDPLAEEASKLSTKINENMGEDKQDALKELKTTFKEIGDEIKVVVAIVEIYTVMYQICMIFVFRFATLGVISKYAEGVRNLVNAGNKEFLNELKDKDKDNYDLMYDIFNETFTNPKK